MVQSFYIQAAQAALENEPVSPPGSGAVQCRRDKGLFSHLSTRVGIETQTPAGAAAGA